MTDPTLLVVRVAGVDLSIDDIKGGLFAASLFPYLAFLYCLGRPESKTPELGLFGFRFLLVFVVATIPAAIAAKAMYGAQLADVDWLHGPAEAFLTLTNLCIVLGFRRAVAGVDASFKDEWMTKLFSASWAAPGAVVLAVAALSSGGMVAGMHAEPGNALSLPTWMVHVSSLIEWLAAMSLIWRYAETTGNPRWKELTVAMIPFHSSGLCACTYHLFYNAPPVRGLVLLQAVLTLVGNFTCWAAAYRIFTYARDTPALGPAAGVSQARVAAAAGAGGTGAEQRVARSEEGTAGVASHTNDLDITEFEYLGSLFALVLAGSVLVKWGSLFLDLPFEPNLGTALTVIAVPSLINCLTWWGRSWGRRAR